MFLEVKTLPSFFIQNSSNSQIKKKQNVLKIQQLFCLFSDGMYKL
jgi:hypothetical protein